MSGDLSTFNSSFLFGGRYIQVDYIHFHQNIICFVYESHTYCIVLLVFIVSIVFIVLYDYTVQYLLYCKMSLILIGLCVCKNCTCIVCVVLYNSYYIVLYWSMMSLILIVFNMFQGDLTATTVCQLSL